VVVDACTCTCMWICTYWWYCCGPRQVLSKAATEAWLEVVESYKLGKSLALQDASDRLLGLLNDLDSLLSTCR
jgi:hypothetical protein